MEDGSELKDVNVFYNKELSDSMIRNKYDFESAMSANKTIFFGGKYIQGGFIPKRVKSYKYLEHELSIDELQCFDEKSEIKAKEIRDDIESCFLIKGTHVQIVQEINKRLNKYR